MKMSSRESLLILVTLIVILIGVTYSVGEKKLAEWNESKLQEQQLLTKVVKSRKLISKKDQVNEDLHALKEQLPEYPLERPVTSELLRSLEKMATDNGLALTSRDPGKEEELGQLDLYEFSITCKWKGDLKALVRFLYALQIQGANLDIRQLTVSTDRNNKTGLKGSFTVDYAYSRTNGEEVQPAPALPSAPGQQPPTEVKEGNNRDG